MNEINGYNNKMEIDDGNEKNENFDYAFGNSGPCILEEYQVKVEEQKKELQEKHLMVKTLQKDYEFLFQQNEKDTKMLESKEQEIERLKRSVNKLQKEIVTSKNEQRRGSKMALPS
mmetsp:Transcript_23012/g.22359  ORF Transcript_23012/g.22359 Transcript_23012/m.22359 type:complete len:116 (+) Transcript_23012:745-1092(+)